LELTDAGRFAACTIVARNYLAQARTLIDSLLEHHPRSAFYLLVVDDEARALDAEALGPGVRVVRPADLALPRFREMAFQYDVTELSTAIKPALLSYMLDQGEQAGVYFDPDIVVYRPLVELVDQLGTASITLIPHLLEPLPRDGLLPDEQFILCAGAYNLGFIGLGAGDETRRFLDWWQERLVDGCRVDVAHGLFVDQKWVDLVPGLFPGTAVLRDETYNVAYWNLASRRLERRDGCFYVGERPLAFFHFSGFDPAKPRTLSRHQNRLSVEEGSALAAILDDYGFRLRQRELGRARSTDYAYGRFDNGLEISLVHRHLYAGLERDRRARFDDPFRTAGPDSFFTWSITPSANGLTPFLEQLLREYPVIRDGLSDPYGRDRARFVTRAQGAAAELGYDARLANPAAWRTLATQDSTSLDQPIAGAGTGLGVNVCGYLRSEAGLGTMARGWIRALRAAGIAVGLRDVSELTIMRTEDTTLGVVDSNTPYDINLVNVNADQHFVVKQFVGDGFFRDHYNIAVWAWELPTFPREWHDRFAEYDEIWAQSTFIAKILGPVSPIPVVYMPPVLTSPLVGSREAGRRRLELGPDEFVFLVVFDFASYVERKNPMAAIAAFEQAFPAEADVRLVIKCVNEHMDRAAFEAMQERAAGRRVSIYSGYWSAQELRDLMAAADAFVSLHRAEGLGLLMAEAMAQGKPVIATGWSGNTDFMTPSNSFLVGYELVELDHDVGPYRAGQVWAEPSVDEAARFMRRLYEDPELARTRGRIAQRDIEQHFSAERVGAAIRQRLAVASTVLAQRRGRPTNGLVTPKALRAPRVPPMELDQSSHGRFGVLAKRGVEALLRYHNHYQGEINLSFAAFMRELEAIQNEQIERIDHVIAQVDQIVAQMEGDRARLHALERAQAKLDGRFAARPYMAVDVFGTRGDLAEPMGYADGTADALDFADLFRGPTDFIAERQRAYLPLLEGRTRIVDLGCGRGEFLELLREQGIDAVGVELDAALVERCRAQGLAVEHADAYDYLAGMPDASLDVIFSAQVIEHFPSDRLLEMLELARRKLDAGGLFIAETVNPESHEALKTFFVDLTHQRPIYPQVLLYLCRQAGYRSARIFYPCAGGFTQAHYQDSGEYAVVAAR
jgi:glycosyltransferase involved in cell wall biosynthesis/SAM-dependent methyltransferase